MQWKRKLSGLLAAVMLVGVLPTTAFAWTAPDVTSWQQASREGVKARFFVGSDTHVGRSGAQQKVANALDAFYQVDPQADGVLLVGDLTDGGAVSQYDTLMSTINASKLGQADKVYLAMGNHDYYSGGSTRFEEKTGQKASEVLTFGNASSPVTVVKLDPNISGNNYTNNYTMLKEALETANAKDPTAPVILIGHHGVKDTAYVTNEWYGSYGQGTDKDMVDLMERYPQVIHISGHSHSTLEDARSICQDDGFTAIQDSTIGAYFENESGKVDPTTGSASTYPEDMEYASQALRIDVLENNTVKIYRMDLTEGKYMYEDEPWTFSSTSLPYTSGRAASSQAPSFAADAQVTVENVTGDSMTVKFPAAAEASDANVDMIHEYWITLTDEAGNETVRKVWSDYYKEIRKTDWSVKVKDLKGDTTYSVAVQAVTSFGAASQAVTAPEKVTTGEGYKPVYPAQAILDVDFSKDATGADAKGHTQDVYGEPQFVKDETLGRTVAVFDGVDDGLRYAMTDGDYAQLTQNFTVELYYKPLDTENNNPMGNTQSAGFCFEQKSGTNTLQFWAHIGGSYKTPEADVTANEWNHIVGTYDGQNVKIYLNGELKDTVAASGAMKEPPHYLFLGGDTTINGALEYQAKCEIALARVYTGTMTAADVSKAYQEASGTTVDVPTADILDVDFSDGNNEDDSANQLTAAKRGSGAVTYVQDETLGKTVANFDGSSAFSYPMSGQYSKLERGMTFAVTFNYNTLSASGEYDLLSNQQSGGYGLGTDGGLLKFFCHVGGGYKTPSTAMLPTGEWHHAVGVYDGSSVKLYVDGGLVSTVAASGSVGRPGSGASEMFIGADSGASNALQFPSDVKIANARIYSQALTSQQIAALAARELPKGDTRKPVLAFASAPAATGKVGQAYSVPPLTITEESSYTASITLTDPSGTVTTIPEDYVGAIIQNGYSYTPEAAGTYTLTYTVTDAAGNQAQKVLTVQVTDPAAAVTLPAADVMDVDFSDGTAADKSETANAAQTIGSPVIQYSEELGKNIAAFNGSYDAYLYPFDDAKHGKMTKGVTIESVFCYNVIPATGESDMFSNQQGGGIGLGLENGRLQFYCNIEGQGYVQPNAAIEAGKWYHAVGVFDGSTVKLYLNGALVDEKAAKSTSIHWTASADAKNFVIGGDSNSSGGAEFFADGSVSLARLYSQPMTGEQVARLYASLEPAMIEIRGEIGSMPLNQVCTVPTAEASSGAKVTVAVTGPDGSPISLTDGKFTPAVEGDYTFTYTVGGSTAKRVIVRSAVDMENLPVNLGLVAAGQAASGGLFNVSIHMNRDSGLTVGNTSFDLTYDPALVSFRGQENAKNGLTITDDGKGTLHVAYTGAVAADAFSNYSATRLVKLTFAAADTTSDADAAFAFENVTIDATTNKKNAEGASVKIYGHSSMDLNGDGLIGAGDVALAADEAKGKLIAAQAAIYPYKHVVLLTMDGGGICFQPDEMYYASNGKTAKTADAAILTKRTNDYAMNLFNEYCAASYSARSETPTISAQNYTSILHGKEYAAAESEYKIDNGKTGAFYYPDFGKETAVYPSVFEALGLSFPNRSNAAFAEWTQIINGIIEPDAPVYTHGSTKDLGDLQDVADYIRSEDWQNTAMVYMQSDYMDGVGHSNGYYTDAYYRELKKFDAYFQAVMDALEETGTKDETLVIFNADHGGTAGGGHGGTTDAEYDVQIALGGQTIDSGKRLTGGTNHDPSVLALTALRAQVPASMDGTADLFRQASLTQEELAGKDRNVETVTATAGTNVSAMELTLSNVQVGNVIKALDVVIDLKGQSVRSLETEGTVVRQEEQDGKLYLTISYDETTQKLVRVNLSGSACQAEVEEYMLGTAAGKEVYGDLVNTTGTLTVAGFSSGGSSSGASSSSKPVVNVGQGGSAALSSDGKTVIIKPDAGYEIADVVVNGVSQGAVASVTVKNGDKVEVSFREIQTSGNPFTDLKGHWAEEDVLKAVEKGLFRGTSSTTFDPDKTLTRGMMVTVLYRLAGEPAVVRTSPFADVADSAYYADAVAWAAEEGIVLGVSETSFAPHAPITRQQLAAVLYRYCGSPAASGSLSPYPDSGSVAAYAEDAMSWAVGSGIIQGSGGKLLPTGQTTRAQAAVMLLRLTGAMEA